MKKKIFTLILSVLSIALVLCACAKEPVNENGAADNAGVSDVAVDYTNFDYGYALDENGYFKDITAGDYVTLPEYMGITVPEDVLTAKEEDIEEQVTYFLENSATNVEVYDRAVEDGDTLNIDYVGSIDGVEFEGGNTQGQGTEVTIGVTQYIDDFLQQLIGHFPGENFDIEVTFPEDYGKEELNGKDAVFNITINYIVGEKIIPELTDDFAVSHGYKSVEDFRASISQWLIEQQKAAYFDTIVVNAECDEIPESIMKYLSDSVIAEYTLYAGYYGMDMDTLLSYSGYETVDDLIADNLDTITKAGHDYLVIQAIAEAEGIVVPDEFITENAADQLKTYGMSYMKQCFLAEMVKDFVFENTAN